MPTAKPMRAIQLVTEGHADEAVALAQALHDQAVATDTDPDSHAAAVTQRLTASLLDVIAARTARDPAALERALSLVTEAHLEGRAAWAAAGRAVAARIMVEAGPSEDVVAMLALTWLRLA